jgi:uncharacterized protein (DUF1501 family)
MDRRDFIKMCSATGVGVVALGSVEALKAAPATKQSLIVSYHLGGGPDWVSINQPKINNPNISKYTEIGGTEGGVRWAQLQGSPDAMGFTANEDFFSVMAPEIVSINGINQLTNGHEQGTQTAWAGNMADGAATNLAVIAAALNHDAPLSFIDAGGYAVTKGLVGASRLGNIGAIKRLAFPAKVYDDGDQVFHSDATVERIQQARVARMESLQKIQKLPKLTAAQNKLFMSRTGQNELKKLVEYLPEDAEGGNFGAAQIATAAYRAGLCQAVTMSTGGYDTHSQNDQSIANALSDDLPEIKRIWDYMAGELGPENVLFLVFGDFGRTPFNADNGKDHRQVSAGMIWGGVNGKRIKGNRVVGATDGNNDIVAFNYKTGQADPSLNGDNQPEIKTGNIQFAIRKILGIENSEAAKAQPLTMNPGEDMTDAIFQFV